MEKRIILLVRTCPYGFSTALEAYRLAQAVGEQDTRVVFIEDGVFVGLYNQKPDAIGMHHIRKTFEMLKDFGAKVYLVDKYLEERNIPASELTFGEVINEHTLKGWIDTSDYIVNLT